MIEMVLAGLLLGNPCQTRTFIQERQVIQSPVVVQVPTTYYLVGEDIRLEILAEKVAQKVVARLEAEQPQQQAAVSESQAIVNRSCIKCHGAESENGDLTSLKDLSDAKLLSVARQVAKGEMPKNGDRLPVEEVLILTEELLAR
jgi:mono/diheme cytochrome c family protein